MLYELKQVELMQSDVEANGLTFFQDKLQGIADAHRALGLDGKVPLKLGHNDEQPLTDGKPALGWAKNLRVVGDKLLADFTDLPKVIYDAIKAGRYKNVSVELLKNVQAGTRIIPWVIDAVALLGADQPAFGNLQDLQSLTMARGQPMKHESRATFTLADPVADLRRQNAELQRQLRETVFKAATDSAIQAGRVTPADVQRFSAIVPVEGRTAEAWQRYSAGLPRPQLAPSRKSHDGTSTEDGTPGDGTAGDQLDRLCAAYVEEQRVKFNRTVQLADAAPIVWRKHPELTRQWHEEQSV